MFFDSEIMIKSLSALASTLSISSSVQKIMKRDKIDGHKAIEKFKENANIKEIDILSDPSVISSILQIMTISNALLEQLARDAQKCENEHIRKRDNAISQTDKDQADADAAQCMCNVLRSIKRHNKGQFPSDSIFQNWWDSYNCKN